jgi:pyruvate dehydrogenase E1 component alpha subunit
MALNPQQWLDLYTLLRLTRMAEDRAFILYRLGKIVGGFYSGYWHEAIAVGSAYALQPDDVVAPLHRDLGVHMVRGLELERYFAHFLGRRAGPTQGKDGGMHIGHLEHGVIGMVSHLPNMLPVAAGAALAFKLRGEPRVSMTFFGDGATSQGDFHEGLNLAAVLQLPVVFICENNQSAYSTPLHEQYAVANIADRAAAYGMPGIVVDGTDVLAVYDAACSAVERARSGGGPSLIEAKTMRVKGHSAADQADYVDPTLLREWSDKDPLVRFETFLRERGLLDDARIAALTTELERKIDAALAWAEAQPSPEGPEVLLGVYTDQ